MIHTIRRRRTPHPSILGALHGQSDRLRCGKSSGQQPTLVVDGSWGLPSSGLLFARCLSLFGSKLNNLSDIILTPNKQVFMQILITL